MSILTGSIICLIIAFTMSNMSVTMSYPVSRYGDDANTRAPLRRYKPGEALGSFLGNVFVGAARKDNDYPPRYDVSDRNRPIPERKQVFDESDLRDRYEQEDFPPIQSNNYNQENKFNDDNPGPLRSPLRGSQSQQGPDSSGRVTDPDKNSRGSLPSLQNGSSQNFVPISKPQRTETYFDSDNSDEDMLVKDKFRGNKAFKTLTVNKFIFQAQPVTPTHERTKKRQSQTVYYFN